MARLNLPDWVPDWRGKTVAIVASGPSTNKADVARLAGLLPTIAIKENVDLAPWADLVYGCDAAWWRNRTGLRDFKGIKVAGSLILQSLYRDVHIIRVRPVEDNLVLDEPLTVGAGGNSGFQALNLAVQFGAERLLLLGFDMTDKNGGVHWYGRNNGPGRNNPCEVNFKRWRAAFARAEPVLTGLGVRVINAAPSSALTCFPRMTVAQAISEWKLEELNMAGLGTA